MRRLSWGGLARSREGGIAVIASISGGLLCGLAALAIDLGSVGLHARKLQGAADLAALAAANDLPRAGDAAQATARANMGEGVSTVTVTGRYLNSAEVAPASRFTAGSTDGADAVRVTLTSPARLYFGGFLLGRDQVDVRRTATAAIANRPPRAMFSIGSRLASLNGGLANALLSDLTGSQVSLSVMDYDALAKADINLLTYLDALALDLNLQAGDYENLLTHTLDTSTALTVLERVAGGRGGDALSKLARAGAGLDLELGRIIGVDAQTARGLTGALNASVSALDLASVMLETAGDRHVQLDLGAQAGLAETRASIAIGERPNTSPWLTVSDHSQPVIRTAQARVYLKVKTAQAIAGLSQIQLPILIELAPGEARLGSVDCTGQRVVVEARPGVATAAIGVIDETRLNDFTHALTPTPATLISVLGLVKATGSAKVELANVDFRSLSFTKDEIDAKAKKTVHTTQLTQGLIASLVSGLKLDIQAVGLLISVGGLTQAIGALLTPLGPVLDGVLVSVLDLLGVRLGEADIRVHGMDCPTGRNLPELVG